MVKTVDDYVDVVSERFPILSKKEIKRILTYGFRMFAYVNKYGCDFLIKDDATTKFSLFVGKLTFDSLKHYQNGVKKWALKERLLSKLRKDEWDGYYYFPLYPKHVEAFDKAYNCKKTKIITIEHAFCRKLRAEFNKDKGIRRIVKFKYTVDCGYQFYVPKMKIRKDTIHSVEIIEKDEESSN